MTTRPAFLAGLLAAALGSVALATPPLDQVVDATLARLRNQQQADGSYGDVITTCKAVLAFTTSARHYVETDGPFVRGAAEFLAGQVDAGGRVRDVADATQAERTARWLTLALATLPGPTAQSAHQRLVTRLASEPPTSPDPELFPLADVPAPQVGAVLERHLASLREALDGAEGPAWPDYGRLLQPLPALLDQVAEHSPDLEVAGAAGTPVPWPVAAAEALLAEPPAATAADLAQRSRALTLCILHAPRSPASSPPPARPGTPNPRVADVAGAYPPVAHRALDFLASEQQQGRFSFLGQEEPGISAMALAAVLQTCRRLEREPPAYVRQGLDWLISLQDDQGAIHAGQLKVYTTSAAMLALQLSGRPEDVAAVQRGAQYLQVVQADEGEGYDSAHDWAYGGIGYGGDLRPDLSNTQFGLEALHAAGIPTDAEAFRRALTFLQRCQNDPEINDRVIERPDGRVVRPGTDGGAVYHPGDSKAGLAPAEPGVYVARSYGSMTYALLKSYLFAGLPLEDPRLQAAIEWIRRNYTVEYNPGFDRVQQPGSEYQGLYYYYYTMAKALDASGLEVVETAAGERRRWRDDLARHLLQTGYQEGYWSNLHSARWWEEMPVLATAYALSALDHCLDD